MYREAPKEFYFVRFRHTMLFKRYVDVDLMMPDWKDVESGAVIDMHPFEWLGFGKMVMRTNGRSFLERPKRWPNIQEIISWQRLTDREVALAKETNQIPFYVREGKEEEHGEEQRQA